MAGESGRAPRDVALRVLMAIGGAYNSWYGCRHLLWVGGGALLGRRRFLCAVRGAVRRDVAHTAVDANGRRGRTAGCGAAAGTGAAQRTAARNRARRDGAWSGDSGRRGPALPCLRDRHAGGGLADCCELCGSRRSVGAADQPRGAAADAARRHRPDADGGGADQQCTAEEGFSATFATTEVTEKTLRRSAERGAGVARASDARQRRRSRDVRGAEEVRRAWAGCR